MQPQTLVATTVFRSPQEVPGVVKRDWKSRRRVVAGGFVNLHIPHSREVMTIDIPLVACLDHPDPGQGLVSGVVFRGT